METKTDKLKKFLSENEFNKALKLGASFKIWDKKEDGEAVKVAFDAYNHKDFYRQINKDPVMLIDKGIEVLKRIYIYGETK